MGSQISLTAHILYSPSGVGFVHIVYWMLDPEYEFQPLWGLVCTCHLLPPKQAPRMFQPPWGRVCTADVIYIDLPYNTFQPLWGRVYITWLHFVRVEILFQPLWGRVYTSIHELLWKELSKFQPLWGRVYT